MALASKRMLPDTMSPFTTETWVSVTTACMFWMLWAVLKCITAPSRPRVAAIDSRSSCSSAAKPPAGPDCSLSASRVVDPTSARDASRMLPPRRPMPWRPAFSVPTSCLFMVCLSLADGTSRATETGGTTPPASTFRVGHVPGGSVADAHVAVGRDVGTGDLGVVEPGGDVHVVDATEHPGAYIDVGRTGHQAGTTAVAAVATGTAVAGRRHGIAGSTAAGPAATAGAIAAVASHGTGVAAVTAVTGGRHAASGPAAGAGAGSAIPGGSGGTRHAVGAGGLIGREGAAGGVIGEVIADLTDGGKVGGTRAGTAAGGGIGVPALTVGQPEAQADATGIAAATAAAGIGHGLTTGAAIAVTAVTAGTGAQVDGGRIATATTGGASRTGPGVDAYTSAVDHGAHLLKGDDAGGGVVGLAHGPGIATAADATAAASGTAPGAIATGAAIGSGRGIVVGVIVVDSPVGTAAYAPASGTRSEER